VFILLILDGLALRDAYDEARNPNIYLNGSIIWKKMTNRQFFGLFLSFKDPTFLQSNRCYRSSTYEQQSRESTLLRHLLHQERNCPNRC